MATTIISSIKVYPSGDFRRQIPQELVFISDVSLFAKNDEIIFKFQMVAFQNAHFQQTRTEDAAVNRLSVRNKFSYIESGNGSEIFTEKSEVS